jgi:hypothetical protein
MRAKGKEAACLLASTSEWALGGAYRGGLQLRNRRHVALEDLDASLARDLRVENLYPPVLQVVRVQRCVLLRMHTCVSICARAFFIS